MIAGYNSSWNCDVNRYTVCVPATTDMTHDFRCLHTPGGHLLLRLSCGKSKSDIYKGWKEWKKTLYTNLSSVCVCVWMTYHLWLQSRGTQLSSLRILHFSLCPCYYCYYCSAVCRYQADVLSKSTKGRNRWISVQTFLLKSISSVLKRIF